jgi:hypothetical protein
LAEVGTGSFHPENDSRPWLRFNLVAHFRQASWLLQRSRITQRVWNEVEELLQQKKMNERSLPAMVDAAFGYRINRAHYVNSALVSEQVASIELRTLVESGMLVAEGLTRGRIYRGSDKLTEIYRRNYEVRSNIDPFIQELLPFPDSK